MPEKVESVFHRSIYLTGPTASGKTAVGVALASRIGAEVIAMDSMTLYRGLDIGTAKPTAAEQRGVNHHLLDVIEPSLAASVADYLVWAKEAATEIESRGRTVLFVGGTPLYLKTLLRGLFEGPGADPTIRDRLQRDAEEFGNFSLYKRLQEVDPITAARLSANDLRRIVRALEVFHLSGRPISHFQQGHNTAAQAVRVFALERDRSELCSRIDQRTSAMFESGLLEEVMRVQADLDGRLNAVPAQGVGYREAIACLEGRISRAEAITQTKIRTRQFSKRQATWIRGLSECKPLRVLNDEPPDATADRIERILRDGEP
jgi:tRNA dimethylallyltransferase